MRFVVAGGGVAGLASALAVARAGHDAVVLERDAPDPAAPPESAFALERRGIPHYFQPHAFLPRGRKLLDEHAPDVLTSLAEAGASEQDLTEKLHGPREPGDEALVYLWARRPLIEWALRRAVAAEPAVDLRGGVHVDGLSEDGSVVADGQPVPGDVVVDALGRYRRPPGWPEAAGEPTDCGAVYYCRYFRLRPGAGYVDAPLLNPRGDLGYLGFNTFRGDNRTFAVIILVPSEDRDLRVLRFEQVWQAVCTRITPLDVMTSPDFAEPITGVMPMGGLRNVDHTRSAALLAVGDAFCHTDPAFAYGLSFALAHARALADAAAEAPGDVAECFRAKAGPESRERHALACGIDAGRSARWRGEPVDPARPDSHYPLFSFAGALTAAPHDDGVLRRTVRRIGLLDRVAVFDEDAALHDRIAAILAALGPPKPPGPPRDELLAHLSGSHLLG
ncbi:FAD-dependent oxidoreductase [Amycolatopsis sp. 3B14]|uniref:FAD-dependent oxidoreductase n=1 Tax=Amycolatopsis sp. 3B14 TaxID=3243600 RepID=UPI003D968C2C